MTQSHDLIKLSNIGVRFGETTLLNDIDLTISPLEIMTLVGPNGAGKTTLVKVILQLIKPTTGKIHRKPNLRIGYMPQKLHIDASMPLTVERFLSLTPKNQSEITKALDTLEIKHLANKMIFHLSGGETQRVLLARALLCQPDLLVLDEPAQGMDVTGQLELYSSIGQIRDKLGCGVLLISHDLHLVMAKTDSVVCLNKHICCHGHPDAVSKDPSFQKMLGNQSEAIALYTHKHDHRHDISGKINE